MCWRSTRLNSGTCTYRRSTSCSPHHLYVINHSTRHSPHGERIDCREKYSLPSYPVGFYAEKDQYCSSVNRALLSDKVLIRSGFNQGRPLMFFASFGSSRFPWQFKKVEEDAAATPDISYLYTTTCELGTMCSIYRYDILWRLALCWVPGGTV
ncbi:hypothetical protein LENED_001215 [Lentinula edodes]|uniref:Uncharacterized protein n=1 Tax=Lentinula edodes TaxID=5353 RepID=A0A1Q3DXJ5_LENED|nr:hypothetical protein LENED_001215 [Lentinula edodes]